MTDKSSANAIELDDARRVSELLWLTLAILVCLRVFSRLVQQSFFFDGTIYSSIARNLAEGIGSAWHLQFSKTLFPLFAEHPPLMMMIQSVGFRLFGDTTLVDRGFTLLTFLGSGVILLCIWRRLNEDDWVSRLAAPLALIFALIAGRVSWAFANGLLENLLIVFTSVAVLLVVEAYREAHVTSWMRRIGLMIAAATAVFLALMTKGPVGLFPLATPGLYWLAFRRPSFSQVLVDSIIILAVIAALFAVLWKFDGPREAVERYWSIQILSSLSGERGNTSGGWSAARTLLRVNAYPLLITLGIFVWAWVSRNNVHRLRLRDVRSRRAIFLLLVGFSASLPLLVSPRVSSFYFNPSLLYFGAGLATLCVPLAISLLSGVGSSPMIWTRRGLYTGLVASLVYVASLTGSLGRDGPQILDAQKIASYMCSSDRLCSRVISTCGEVWQNWALHAYLQRSHKLSLAPVLTDDMNYLLADESCDVDASGFKDVGIGLSQYRLLQR
ncbi:hypothetical protein PDO_1275 [Rhizobium sp. PDO1-076]|uniref:ArnT family glycosyltransferase n=1 Tax=Rhizobium sp. PDO1-076 TaxID=1125979 RepID=UPI00024E2EB4|nr:hypothetical protein [Rhizobium sp. PDO1-076]EHS52868.1 hypothetical protein PDO_1275 [Rhizobium sp. PDO1-076]